MDPIAAMFSQMSNASAVGHTDLTVPYSKLKMAILEVLKKRGQIVNFHPTEKTKEKKIQHIRIELKTGHAHKLHRVSRPGHRVYASAAKIPRLKRPSALVIVSTSLGVLEGEEARKKGLGGEILAMVR